MAKELFPMYCGLSAIKGMEEEKEICNTLLGLAKAAEKLIVLIPMNGDAEWVYGQCNFLHDSDHVANFKFSNTRDALRDQGVVPGLINAHGVGSVLFTDRAQYEWFSNEGALRKYKGFFFLLKKSNTGYVRP